MPKEFPRHPEKRGKKRMMKERQRGMVERDGREEGEIELVDKRVEERNRGRFTNEAEGATGV